MVLFLAETLADRKRMGGKPFGARERNRGRTDRVVDDEVVERQIDQMARTMAVLPSEGYAALHVLRDGDEVAVERG